MGEGLVNYIERMELLAFFAGYPLLFAIVQVVAGKKNIMQKGFASRLVTCLPLAYALTGTLYLSLVLKNMQPEYSLKSFAIQFENSFLKIWGLTAILFWIPLFRKKAIFSLLHSLVFFFLLLNDLFMYMRANMDREMIQNDMKIYTISLIINTTALFIIMIMHFFLKDKSKGTSSD